MSFTTFGGGRRRSIGPKIGGAKPNVPGCLTEPLATGNILDMNTRSHSRPAEIGIPSLRDCHVQRGEISRSTSGVRLIDPTNSRGSRQARLYPRSIRCISLVLRICRVPPTAGRNGEKSLRFQDPLYLSLSAKLNPIGKGQQN